MTDSAPRARGAGPPLLKDLNERTVLETIRADAPISRAEISRRAGISKPTVSLALQSLLAAGLVREAAREPRYGATFFEPVPDAALVLGVDVGARFLRGAICDLDGRLRARQDVEILGHDARGVLAAIVALRESLVPAAGLGGDRVDRVVVGVPGVVDSETRSIALASVPGLEDEDFGGELERRLDLPVALENDVNLAAVGERWRGVARGVDDFVFLSVGTGMGAGLVLRGELHRGIHGAAGEVDYALAAMGPDLDPCAGALSAYVSALAHEGRHETKLTPPYETRDLFAAARSGDPLGRAAAAEAARRIAAHIVPIAAVADVSLAVLGGGIGSNGDLLVEPVRRHLADWVPYPPRVEVSSLGEANVLTGALAIGLRTALESVFVNRVRVRAEAVS
jgi:predicted NBD/HSP70 family sugar kinase